MEQAQLMFAATGALIFVFGLVAGLRDDSLLGRIIAINISGVGLFLLLVALAYRGLCQAADPIPHALVLTGIVVAVAASGLAIAIGRKLDELRNSSHRREGDSS
ncbi:NADH-quinone oxidoreductase subunit K [Motiliproteus sp. SC1-56]|uniref:NADH-quinone oxidoreductase subunit K n=1 Tax=Motiliproteus sp. SC1-56 TaxID=2799565 RepID=UPI001A8D43EE|nr:NADH-quinone oxidoreductase subunit K [Motiliproteus sp. SC1-56]